MHNYPSLLSPPAMLVAWVTALSLLSVRAAGDFVLLGDTVGDAPLLCNLNLQSGIATDPRATVYGLVGIAFDAQANSLYGMTTFAGDPPNALVSISLSDGTGQMIGPTGLPFIYEGDLALDPLTGTLFGVQNAIAGRRELFTLNTATGAATTVGSIAPTGDFSALAFSPDGTLFAINTSGDSTSSVLVTLNPSTGAILSSGSLGVNLGNTAGLAFHPETGVGYVADGGNLGTDSLYELNNNGSLRLIGHTGITTGFAGLTFVPEPATFAALLLLTFRRLRK
ncbi:MAG: hypothetical protein HZB38_17760 [Planctomycetes bacterium]|nr:hypothetical protein [Planctomycetota bacterium]